jgi:hypothetical protein
MNYPFKEFAKVGILRQIGKAKCKKMAKIDPCDQFTAWYPRNYVQNYCKRVRIIQLPVQFQAKSLKVKA